MKFRIALLNFDNYSDVEIGYSLFIFYVCDVLKFIMVSFVARWKYVGWKKGIVFEMISL
jgi:hypothetical protein